MPLQFLTDPRVFRALPPLPIPSPRLGRQPALTLGLYGTTTQGFWKESIAGDK